MARTAKKPTAKKSKTKSSAARTSRKSVSKKTTAKKPEAKSNLNRTVTLEKLYKFNIFAAVANIIFAVLSVVFLSRESVSAVLTHATKDELASESATVLGTAYKTLLTVEVKYVLATIFLLSAVFSLLLATRLRNNYENGVRNSSSLLRWLFMGIILGLVLEFVTLLAQVEDIMTLKLVAGLIITTTVLAWMAERENSGTKKRYNSFALSIFTGTIAWLPLLGSLIGSAIYGAGNLAWYVYLLSVVVLIGFISICLTQYRQIQQGVTAKGYLQLEGKYLSTDFLIKLAVFVIILVALYK